MPFLTADLTGDRSLRGSLRTWLERGFAKVFLVTNLIRGGKKAAAKVGIDVGMGDYIAAAAAALVIGAIWRPTLSPRGYRSFVMPRTARSSAI